jgi:ABC-type hemin transport system ATPase subunit
MALELLPEAQLRVLNKLIATSEDEDLRVRVLRKLVQLEKAKAALQVKAIAMSAGPRARVAAIRLLGQFKADKEAQKMLVDLLNEPDERLRVAAALTLVGG